MKSILIWFFIAESTVFLLKNTKKRVELQGVPEVRASDYFDEYYYLDARIGNPEAKFNLLIDINTPHFWVSDVACKDCEEANNFYNQTKSSASGQSTNQSVFNDSTLGLSGIEVFDRVKFSEQIILNNCSFISALNVSYFGEIDTDGVIGLALGTSSTLLKNIVVQMVNSSIIAKPSFSLYFSSNMYDLISTTDPPATIVFGGHDEKKYALDEMAFIKAKSGSQVWESELSGIQAAFPNQEGKNLRNQKTSVVFDTTSNYIGLPHRDYNLFYEIVDNEFYCLRADNQLFCTCSSLSKFPILTFTIDDYEFNLEPADYIQTGSYMCRVLVRKVDDEKVKLGLPFFRKFYSFFDYDKKVIGFATAAKSVIVILDGGDAINLSTLGVLGMICTGLYLGYMKKRQVGDEQNYRKI
jgi:hypothetical protein